MDRHIQGVNPSSMMAPAHLRQPVLYMDNLELLDPTDPMVDAAVHKEQVILETVAPVWCCALCRDSTQEPEAPVEMLLLKSHLKNK